MANEKEPYHITLANRIIAQLEQGTAPWFKPWGDVEFQLPYNPVSKARYSGGNVLKLMSAGFADPRWLTYKQAESIGAQVSKGSKAELIQRWIFHTEQIKRDENNQPILGPDGKPIKEKIPLERPKVMNAYVFNAEQIEGLPSIEKRIVNWDPIEKSDAIITNSGANIEHKGNRAYYRMSTDKITMPDRTLFSTAENYYSVLLHELGHWTGHESRLDRQLGNVFGSEDYAKEELRAEIGSMLLEFDLGLKHDKTLDNQHLSYIDSWIKVLKNDPMEIVRAARDAEKIQKYVMSLSLEQQQTLINTSEVRMQTSKENKTIEFINELQANFTKEKTWLAIPFLEKDRAKKEIGHLADGSLAIAFDKTEKRWYAKPGARLDKISAWLPENQIKPSPQEAFEQFLRENGAVFESSRLKLDGNKHRIKVERDTGASMGAEYAYYEHGYNGHPAGMFNNFRHDTNIKWSYESDYQALTESEKTRIAEIANQKKEQNYNIKIQNYAKVSEISTKLSEILPNTPTDHEYVKNKKIEINDQTNAYILKHGIETPNNVFIAKDHKTAKSYKQSNPDCHVFTHGDLLIPIINAEGVISTVQTISKDGTKRFMSGGKKSGNFAIMTKQPLKDVPAIVISEGFATAKTLQEALGYNTVAAMDAGNLKSVAQALNQKYPEKPIIICGDVVAGYAGGEKSKDMEKAVKAAEAVKGTVIFPVFAPGENDLTDFNDLVSKSKLGKDAVIRQVVPIVEKAIQTRDVETQAIKQEQELRNDKKMVRTL